MESVRNTSTKQFRPMSWVKGKEARLPPQFTAREEEIEWLSRTAKDIAQINSDVHGISDGLRTLGLSKPRVDDETTLLSALDTELSKLPKHRKSAFCEAQRKCPQLVDNDVRLSFLRTEDFNAKSAAERLTAYWERKRNLFGAEKCFLPVTLRGAMKDDAFAIFQGIIRILPSRDNRGRVITFVDHNNYKPGLCSTESLLRACWYVLSVASEYSEQVVLLSTGKDFRCLEHFNYELYTGIVDLERCYLPFRYQSLHHCYPSMFFHLISPIVKYFMGGRLRARWVCHAGSEKGVLEKLESFGFPRETVPVELGGGLLIDQRKWLRQRLLMEERVNQIFGIHEACAIESEKTYGLTSYASDTDESIKDLEEPMPSCDDTLSSNAEVKLSSAKGDNSDSDVGPSSGVVLQASQRAMSFNKGDPRMNAALAAKLKNPEISLLDALLEGGFEFNTLRESGFSAKKIFDIQNVSLYQRKNQLNRRIRKEKKRQKIDDSDCMPAETEQKLEVPSKRRADLASLDLSGKDMICEVSTDYIGTDCAVERQAKSEEGATLTEPGSESLTPIPATKDGLPVRRDSFYDMITELPGLVDLPEEINADNIQAP